MRYPLVLFLLVCSGITHADAQVQMRGVVTAERDGKIIPLEFANVVLYDATDSTKIITGTITDLTGNYLFNGLEIGHCRLVVSCVGYKPLIKSIRIIMPSMGDVLIRNYTLEQDVQMLQEVVTQGQLRHQYIDKVNYTFTSQEVKSARYAKDLLENLPGLTIDAQSQTIKSLRSGAIHIMINGAAATDNEMKLVPPDKVLRVEYYDIPPARYAKKGAVINVITRTLDDGYGGGVDLSQSPMAGFGNNNAYFSYHRGRNQISFEYSLSYRNYKDRRTKNLYQYTLDNETRESLYQRKNKFGYTVHNIGAKFTNQVLDNYIFQLSVKPNIETRFDNGKADIHNIFGEIETAYTGINRSKTSIFNPVIDGYYWKSLSPKSDISVNVVGTMFHTSVNENNHEYLLPTMEQTLEDNMHLKNDKKSLIGEIVYTYKIGLNNWNTGYKMDASWLNSDIDNLFGEFDYQSYYTEQYLYSEITGKKNKLLYRISLGGTYITNKSFTNKYNQFVFTPTLMVGCNMNDHNSLRLLAMRSSELPSVSDLSNNAQLITPDIVNTGNPMLEHTTETGAGLIYTFNNRFLDVNAAFLYSYKDNPINQYFIYQPDDKYIALTKENAVYSQLYGGALSAQIKPFGTDVFAIKTFVQIMRQYLKSNLISEISNWYCPVYVDFTFKMNNWHVTYQHKFTSMNLDGAYLTRDENVSNLMARYRYNDFSFMTGVYWLFTPSKYSSRTLEKSIVYNRRDSKIWDNKSMVVVGVSWIFNKGNVYDTKRTLNNEDKDAVTF